jgi:alkylation response protein AidB-like acyl-CoA dehydrogenase
MVRATAAEFVADRLPVSHLRALRDANSKEGFDPEIWKDIASLGWTGIAVPEAFGGAGLGVRALAMVIEEMGKTLAPSPLASTALVAATVLSRCAPQEVAARWLPKIAAGEIIAALAIDEDAHVSSELPTAIIDPDGKFVTGSKRFVADGAAANLLLASASHKGSLVLALVDARSPSVSINQRASIDSRGLADIEFLNTPVDAILTSRDGRCAVEHALDCARVGLAAEMLGAAALAFEVTLNYLRMRRQFGQIIGSFQALQHRAAKLFIQLEMTRSCVGAASDALHYDDSDLPRLASLAKASAGEMMRLMAHEMIQLHGGIGMTDAHDAGLYLKRGRVAAMLHGDSAFHVDRYAALKGY